jgi:hypothetical protein
MLIDFQTGSIMPAKKRPTSDTNGSGSSDVKKNKSDTDFADTDFICKKETKSGKKWNFKLSTW